MKSQLLYIHVPFCSRRCSYCDFSIAVRRQVPAAEYVTSVVQELRIRAADRARDSEDPLFGPELLTLYMGGGTPSKLGPDGVADLIARVLREAGTGLSDGAEVTLEANPEDVTPAAVEGWVRAGVNRLSVGVQSFDPGTLQWMHRTHTAEASAQAVAAARAGGIQNVSIDLIFAVPSELGRDWSADLDKALALEPSHLSVYGLTVEPRTPLGRWAARGQTREAPEERYADEFLAANERLTGAGFEHYEVSSYARHGHRGRHNSAYWVRVPYVGIGPSAHSFDGVTRRWNSREFVAWSDVVENRRDPLEGSETLVAEEVESERIYLGLRTSDGLNLARLARWSSKPERLSTETEKWVKAGFATRSGTVIRLTPEGWLRLDSLAAALTPLEGG